MENFTIKLKSLYKKVSTKNSSTEKYSNQSSFNRWVQYWSRQSEKGELVN